MSAARRRARQVLSGLLILALAALGFMLWRGPALRATAPGIPTATGLPAPSVTALSAGGALAPLPTIDLTLAAIVRPSPLQDWASAVLDTTEETLNGESRAALTVSALLPGQTLQGLLTLKGGGIAVGGQSIAAEEQDVIELVVPAPAQPDAPVSVGRIERRSGSLALSLYLPGDRAASRGESVRSLSGDVTPIDALAALVETAQARDLTLLVAYHETAGQQASLALLDVQPAAPSESPATPSPVATTITPITSPGPTGTATPTLVYQVTIKLAVEHKLIPLIDAARRSPDSAREALNYYQQHHPWVGPLAWDEEHAMPLAAGRPLALQAGESRSLTLFGLKGEEAAIPMSEAFLESAWDGDGTTVDDGEIGQWYYGDRLSEIVYWMVRVADDEGGQLTVAYDSVGSYRALTVIDFQPYPLSPGS